MNDNNTVKDQVFAVIQEEIADKRAAAETELDPVKRDRLSRHARLPQDFGRPGLPGPPTAMSRSRCVSSRCV